MKKMMKFFIKLLVRIIVIAVIVISLVLLFLKYPYILFESEAEHRGITIYSDEKFDDSTDQLINNILERVTEIEIYETSYTPSVYLINDQSLFEKFAQVLQERKHSLGLNLIIFDNIFINAKQVNKISSDHNPDFKHTHYAGALDQIIAHQMVKGLIKNRIGYFDYFRTPSWKIGGYCEYGSTIASIRKDKTTSLLRRAKPLYDSGILDYETQSVTNYKSQLLVEYLGEIHKLTFEEIIYNPIDYNALSAEFDEWYYYQILKK
ncbi:MAG: hypothetical protein KKA84_12435 [Bacteroidetes bacterium]|nr:hypothetical protein [Bacteroidota bacterium]